MLVRQRIIDLRDDVKDDGTRCCGIVLDTELVAHPAASAPRVPGLALPRRSRSATVTRKGFEEEADAMPRAMREELRALRLIDW